MGRGGGSRGGGGFSGRSFSGGGGSRGFSSGSSRGSSFGSSRSSSGSRSSGSSFRSSNTYSSPRPTNLGRTPIGGYRPSVYVRPIITPRIYNFGGYTNRANTAANYGNTQGSYNGNTGAPGGNNKNRKGCLWTLVIIMILLLIIPIIFSTGSGPTAGETGVARSTYQREALKAGSVKVDKGYYTDAAGWIGSASTLKSGMRSYYDETGVMPYLYITDNIYGAQVVTSAQAEAFCTAVYDELFSYVDSSGAQVCDEAHLLMVFFEPYSGDYEVFVLVGEQAGSVIDDEARQILIDYIDRYYYDESLSDEEFFAKAFKDAGVRTMTVTEDSMAKPLLIMSILGIICVVFVFWTSVEKRKKEKAEEVERILNTPLETLGDGEAEELAKKYGSDQSSEKLADKEAEELADKYQ